MPVKIVIKHKDGSSEEREFDNILDATTYHKVTHGDHSVAVMPPKSPLSDAVSRAVDKSFPSPPRSKKIIPKNKRVPERLVHFRNMIMSVMNAHHQDGRADREWSYPDLEKAIHTQYGEQAKDFTVNVFYDMVDGTGMMFGIHRPRTGHLMLNPKRQRVNYKNNLGELIVACGQYTPGGLARESFTLDDILPEVNALLAQSGDLTLDREQLQAKANKMLKHGPLTRLPKNANSDTSQYQVRPKAQ